MKNNKEDNSRLIKELKERIRWYQEEASEEEGNAKEIEAMIHLLDRLEELPVDEYFTKEKAYTRFEGQYLPQITENRENLRNIRIKKVLSYIIGTAATIVVLFAALNIGTYATTKKGFFEYIALSTTGKSFFISGGETKQMETLEEGIGFSMTGEKVYKTWTELPDYLLDQICVPTFLPKDMKLQEISFWVENFTDVLRAKYMDEMIPENRIEIWVESYEDAYAWQETINKEAVFLEEQIDGERTSYFYQYEESYFAYFWEEHVLYTVSGNCSKEDLKEVVKHMQYIGGK